MKANVFIVWLYQKSGIALSSLRGKFFKVSVAPRYSWTIVDRLGLIGPLEDVSLGICEHESVRSVERMPLEDYLMALYCPTSEG